MSRNTKKAIQELVLGRELTYQLRDLLTKSLTNEESLVDASEDLVTKIRNTFANTLTMLRNAAGDGDYYNDGDNEAIGNMSSDGRKSEDSCESIKSTSSTLKDRRGSYKRRKCVESRKKITSALIDDGHAWRKYGQKQILNANHPRSYYRCTHKTEQLCQATKQVQQIQDNPPKFETIYYSHHTCKNNLKTSQFIIDNSDTRNDSSSSIILNFASNDFTNKQDDQNPFFPSIKKIKSNEDYRPIGHEIAYNGSSSSTEYILSPRDDDHDLTAFDIPSVLSADDHDVISGVVDSVVLDDFCFGFEEDSVKACWS